MNLDSLVSPSFRGVVCVVRQGEVLCRHAAGYADLPNQIPNTVHTRFASASAGKVFVAAAILQLIHAGSLALDSTLGRLLPIPLGRIDPDVTVRQLLTHVSGVPDYFDESVMSDYEELWADFPNYKIRRNADLFPLFLSKPMMYPRGARFQYNNTGYVLLAAVIEQLTGKPFDQYLQENIFAPCGMDSTGYYELDRLPARCANNYIACPDHSYRTNIFSVDVKGTGAGGAFITVEDVIRFWHGLTRGHLLPADLTAQMFSRQSGSGDSPDEGYYGYGVWLSTHDPRVDCPYFQGCDPGVSFLSEYNPREDTISVLVSNYGDDVWHEMATLRKTLYSL